MVGYLLYTYRRHLSCRGLLAAVGGAAVLHTVFVSFRTGVKANGYGPRFLTDIVPLFVMAAIVATRAALDGYPELWRTLSAPRGRRRRRLEIAAVALSVVIHGSGVVAD